MNKKINRNIIIGIMIFSLIISVTINKSYAKVENMQREFEIEQNEENKFIEDIHNTETNTLKIRNIDKQISSKNYTNKEIIETKELDRQDIDYINQEFGEKKNYNDGEYKGELTIADIKVENIDNGYYETIDEKMLNFSNYSDNDLNNIEKEIILNNTKYYLIYVNWEIDSTETIDGENVPQTYKGNRVYQAVKKVSNPNTYKVTVTYSGTIEKINTIYDYTVTYENNLEEKQIEQEKNEVVPTIIISGLGLTIILIILLNMKNTYVYSKTSKGFKIIKKVNISDKNLIINITNCKNINVDKVYAIKVNKLAFNKLKGRTISLILGNKKKDIVLWNDYYEIKM